MNSSRIALAAVVVLAGLAGPAGPAAAATVQCPASADVFVWDGGAGTPNWDDAANWDTDCTPGLRVQTSGDGYDDLVTIPVGAAVALRDGESAHIAALTNRGTLTVATGARLVTSQDSTSSRLVLRGLLAGTGRFTVTTRLDWVSGTTGAATQATRECTSTCTEPVGAGGPGTTVVAPGATMVVSGRGVNLQDERVIENRGTVSLTGSGYVAADYGTWFRNLRASTSAPVPRLLIRNDGGYYQGFARPGYGPGRFTNGGRVVKDGGTGLSVIDADYVASDPGSVSAGVVEVRAGRLSIEGDAGEPRAALVQQGRSFANGGCADGATPTTCATLRPTGADPQQTSVELTRTGTTLASVTLTELAPLTGTGHRGVPVEIHAPDALSAPTAPLRFRLLLDASLLSSTETADQVARNAPVFRQSAPGAAWVRLPSCGTSGNPTTSQPSCVSRALSRSETAALGSRDVVLVVSSLQNSRYRIGR